MGNSKNLNQESCPNRESVLSVFENRTVSADQAGAMLNHVSRCRGCRQAISFICAAIATEKRRRMPVTLLGWSRVFSTIDLWMNRATDDIPDALAATAPVRMMVFVSKVHTLAASKWRAEVNLPAPDDPNGVLQVTVLDEDGNPLHGRFRLCGIECDVEDGKIATISAKEFRANHSFGGVAFSESGKPFTEGVPVISSIP